MLSTLHRSGGLMDELVRSAREADANGGQTADGYRLINWCLWEVIERCPPSRECKGCPLADDCRGVARNAGGFFRIDDAIRIKARSSRAAWESEMLCKGPHRQYLVFEEFDASRHVGPVTYADKWPLYRCIDFGYASPLTCLWLQITPMGAVHVIQEYSKKRLPVAQHAAEILRRDPGPVEMTYVDPAGRQTESTSGRASTEILRAAGIPTACSSSRIADGLELIRAALAPAVGEPTLRIHPLCRTLIRSFESYHFPAPGQTGQAGHPRQRRPRPRHRRAAVLLCQQDAAGAGNEARPVLRRFPRGGRNHEGHEGHEGLGACVPWCPGAWEGVSRPGGIRAIACGLRGGETMKQASLV